MATMGPVSAPSAFELLKGLVSIPSLSGQEAAAAAWLVEQMGWLGYGRAAVDAAGNAVGEIGRPDAGRVVVLLGHIDTVPGEIPVRVEETAAGWALFGRGSVDAKGPLAAFTAAAAACGEAWAAACDLRLVVVGAVEEEAATSRGARFICDRFDGRSEPVPSACIIGEPSGWDRVTLGYKGRLLIELDASQPTAHSAGPQAGIATVAVDLWNWIDAEADAFNAGCERAFDQLLPSLRGVQTSTEAGLRDRVWAQIGVRLPPDFDAAAFATRLTEWLAGRLEAPAAAWAPGAATGVAALAGRFTAAVLRFHAYEPAWRGERGSGLVRAFMGAIREVDAEARAGFVVKTGTSDMNVVGPLWRCPILAYGAGDSRLDHTPHEHLLLADYERGVRVLERALRRLPATLP